MKSKEAEQIFTILDQNNPNPTTELIYKTPFQLLVAVILSAQATDVSVNKASKELFDLAETAEKMIQLGEIKLKNKIRSIGLFNTKAKNIIKTCKILIDHHQGIVPDNRAELEALPGVGRKTANVILNTAFGKPTIAVDTHVFRVANRTGLATGKTPYIVEQGLLEIIPKRFLKNAHHLLILHGRYVCISRKPLCYNCSVCSHCKFNNGG
ncbi:MAG TPA: endonuclease III [Gammaproteobacteria bacterium]|jgi:endonuclease-3|nr:endonuclease III [Gammaproteobacteria bacterium]HJP41905.1 endonuclease III [Gammaproteobacteria bacterium]|tara:strand:- start:123 stop:752 length:630 start_codon:yes stop_codon:yes gene_type:complete